MYLELPTVSETLSEWAESLEYEAIPTEFRESAKLDILDMLGCGFFGSTLPWVKISAEMVKDWGGQPEATIWGHAKKVPAVNAVLANAHAVNSFEFDDTYVPTGIHPGALVVTSALAAAESTGAITGKEFIVAVVAGHEVSARVRLGLGWSVLHGWNSTAICSTFGAAVASALILGLDADGISDAMGIAGPYVGGLLTYGFGAMAKRIVNARSAQGGMMASLLAKRGFTGFRDILESDQGGFCSAHSTDCKIEAILDGLGKEYEMRKLALKKYPCCTSFHAVVDAISDILDEMPFSPDDIASVEIQTTSGALKNNVGSDYNNLSSAQMSMEYAAAARILHGELGIAQYQGEEIGNPKLRRMIQKIRTSVDADLDSKGLDHRMAAKAVITLKSGVQLESSQVTQPKKMTPEEVLAKFRSLASTCVDRSTVEQIIAYIDALDHQDALSELASMLRKETNE